jgi:hypothetical protein
MLGQSCPTRLAAHVRPVSMDCASPHLSESLRGLQAFRTSFSDSSALQGGVETISDRRRRKLEALAHAHRAKGGLAYIAETADVSVASLDQIIKGVLLPAKADGPRSPRSLGSATARQIEAAMKLGDGWFDAPDDASSLAPDALAIAEAFDALPMDSASALEVRQALYWAMQNMLAGAAGRPSNAAAPAPVARPTDGRRRRQ